MSSMINKRLFAIDINNNQNYQHVLSIIEKFRNIYNITDRICVFGKNITDTSMLTQYSAEYIEVPLTCDNISKTKNYILSKFEIEKFDGIVHLIEDNVEFFDNPITFINTVENTMCVLDYDIYFSTTTDICNYIYNKFNPRITLDIDDEKMLKYGISKSISFTSHSNIAYTIWNFRALQQNVPKFDERFSIAMYIIIEFLARRRALKRSDQLYFMNQYLSIDEEQKVFGIIGEDKQKLDQNLMQKEDAIFKSLNINYNPDNSIDLVLDSLYSKLMTKNTSSI